MSNPQRHILIVDDSEDDRVMYTQYLTRQGHRTSVARDGEEALEKALELQPHAILLDLWLPIVSGLDVIRHLKANEKTRHIPILVITGNTTVRPADCDGWLTKPCLLENLGAEINRILESRITSDGPALHLDADIEPQGNC